MTIQDSLQHPWIKVCPYLGFTMLDTCGTMKTWSLNVRFLFQPKDTQQALSRKESAVNMEKFKKFAARRKWKVNIIAFQDTVQEFQGILEFYNWVSFTLWPQSDIKLLFHTRVPIINKHFINSTVYFYLSGSNQCVWSRFVTGSPAPSCPEATWAWHVVMTHW